MTTSALHVKDTLTADASEQASRQCLQPVQNRHKLLDFTRRAENPRLLSSLKTVGDPWMLQRIAHNLKLAELLL